MLTQEAKTKIDYDRYLEEHANTRAEGELISLAKQTRKCLNLGLSFTEAFDRLFITDPYMQEKVKAILNS